MALEHFQAKWTPVRVEKMRQNKTLERSANSIGTDKARARSLSRMVLIGAAVVALSASVACDAAGRDLASMSGEEVRILQQRLADAGCYKGAIEGRVSSAVE